MNAKTAKQLRKIAKALTTQVCEAKKVPVENIAYLEIVKNRKKAKRLKDGIDKAEAREYEYKKQLGLMNVDKTLEDKYYETYDIALGTIKLSDVCIRKIYKNLKMQVKKGNLNKSSFVTI